MKAFAVALAAASALSFLPLLLLVRATRAVVPGKGPQGGEALFLLWVLFLSWAWAAAVAAFVSAGLVLGSGPLVRFVLFPAGAVAGCTAWVVAVFLVLSKALEPPAAGSGPGSGVALAGLLAALLLAGSQAVHLRAAWIRP